MPNTNKPSSNPPSVSIVIPTFNEEKYIASCLNTILEQDYPQSKLQIFVIDGNSKDKTKEVVEQYVRKYDYIKLLNNPHKIVPYALNIGINAANGEVIIRIDAHSYYPSNYISVRVKNLFELNADNVGGVWITGPGNSSNIAKAIAIGASHPFGVGSSLHKIGADKITITDTVPYGCYKRSVFEKIGLFDTDLVRNQDDEFNGRLIKNGGKIYLIPEVKINYFARTTFSKLIKMFYQYGLFKPLVNRKLGAPATLRQFFPPVFALGLAVGLILSLLNPYLAFMYTGVILLYIIIAFYYSFKESIKNSNYSLIFLLPYTFFLIHTSYGFGYLAGILKFMILKQKSSNVNISR